MLAAHNGSLSTLLIVPLKEKSDKPAPKKSCGRILTSKENIKAMEEKEQIKKQKLRQKEERKQQLEKRRQEKAELAAEKKRQKESKEKKRTQGPKKKTEHGLEKKGKTADSRGKCEGESITSFTEKEIKLFETRLENGYDLTTDARYNAWLKTKCPRIDDGLQEPSVESSVCDLSACRDGTCGSTG